MKLMILDGNSIVNRTFYGVRMLNAPDGTPTNGIYGFLTVLRKLIEEEQPHSLCVAFDLKAPTFRHLQYENYKAQRKAMPDELAVQIPILKEVLDVLNIKRLELEGYEADDLIGTVSRICAESGHECVIVTGDKDSFQLITESTHVKHVKSRMGKTETTEYTPEVFFEEYGFEPKHIIDLKALMGDSSDNIPGVKGIGEKTATDLIRTYRTIDKIYADIEALDIKDSVKSKLIDGKADAEMSYKLATIDQNAPIELCVEDCAFSRNYNEGYAIFKRLGFNSLIEKWGISDTSQSPSFVESSHLPLSEITDGSELRALATKFENLPFVAVLPLDGSLDGLEICDGEKVYLLRWANLGDNYNIFIKTLFSPHIKKLSHNNKDFLGLILSESIDCGGFIFDTALASYLLDPAESSYELSRISMKYLGTEKHGAEAVFALFPVQTKLLQDEGMLNLLEEIELPLCDVLADMEHMGFMVDKQALFEYGKQLSVGIEE